MMQLLTAVVKKFPLIVPEKSEHGFHLAFYKKWHHIFKQTES